MAVKWKNHLSLKEICYQSLQAFPREVLHLTQLERSSGRKAETERSLNSLSFPEKVICHSLYAIHSYAIFLEEEDY